jgi:hypothetical protein
MGHTFVFALTAALNPTLLAAVTVMLTLPSPARLLSGYLCGAFLTSFVCGLILVFTLPGSSTSNTAKKSVSPAIDLALGALILIAVFVVGTGRDRRRRAWSERRRERAQNKPEPRWKRVLSRGSERDTFAIGIVLSFPGASYIAGMDSLHKQHLGTVETVLLVLAFNLVQLALLEIPLIGYSIRPQATEAAVGRFTDWLSRRGGRAALIVAGLIGAALIVRGFVYL